MHNDKPKKKILFILKLREIDDESCYSYTLSSGLKNSATFVKDMLLDLGCECKLVEVVDNNQIDKEVYMYRPDVVIIEALWVVPEKFEVLTRLHPNVEWIIRLHSETPFLSNEGVASGWLYNYSKYFPKVRIGANSKRLLGEYEHLLNKPIYYMPNYYPVDMTDNATRVIPNNEINIACMGAIRPLKNQLLQAHAAIIFADKINKRLKFHMNGSREECQGSATHKNIRILFENSKHDLIEIPWLPHNLFIKYLRDNIDLASQVSFSETFNIVAADSVNANIPTIVSDEIQWASRLFKADPTSCTDVVNKLLFAYRTRKLGICRLNKLGLALNSKASRRVWSGFIEKEEDN